MTSRHSTCRATGCRRRSEGRRATRPRARSASLWSWLPSCCSREPSSMARGCEYPPVRPCYGSRLLTRCGDAAVTSPRRSVVNHKAPGAPVGIFAGSHGRSPLDSHDCPAETARDCQQKCQRAPQRSEEHTSELQSPCNLVCRLLLEKK